MESFLSSILYGFRKAHNTQVTQVIQVTSFLAKKEQKGFGDTILMDLSKANDCMPHDLLIAKFERYGIDKIRLALILDYLTRRKQRMKIYSSCSCLGLI